MTPPSASLFEQLEALADEDAARLVEPASGRSATFAELVAEAKLLAGQLVARHGVLPGDRVLAMVPPGLSFATSLLGVLFAGASVVPVALSAPAPEVAYYASDARVKLAVASAEHAGVLPASLERLDPQAPRAEASASLPALSPDLVALVLYTSGTTGRPKGAMLTHRNLGAQTTLLRGAWWITRDDVLLHTLPMHHTHGLVVAFLTALTSRASVRMLPRFDAEQVVEELRHTTVFMSVPTILQRVVERLEDAGLPVEERAERRQRARSQRLVTSGSAALPVSLADRWRALTGTIPLERYGMTEIGMALSNPLDPSLRKRGTVGQPLPTVETRIVGEDGTDTSGPGELWVRGPSVMAGYLDRPEATAAAFTDGWFRTGDVATLEDGYVRLLGRSSTDILKSGGEKISAIEIEEVLREHDAIADVAVVGVPDDTWGDRVIAAVVPVSGRAAECATEPLRAWAKARLAPFKVPKEFVVLDALPRNAMGKVVKPELVTTIRARSGS